MHLKHNFVYFGTPKVASDTLALLIEHGFVPSLVVTSPDAPQGRGHVLTPSPTRVCAEEHNIPVLTPLSLDAQTIDTIRSYSCEYGVTVAYGKIFPQELIDAFPQGVLNIHYSLLPKYRGATPLEGALLSGESETGVTIQKMVYELDAGDILAQESVVIAPTETAREVRPRLITLGAELLIKTLPLFESGEITPQSQPRTDAPYTKKIKKEDGLLDLSAGAETNWNKYRAYADTIGTYFFEAGARVKITSATFKNGKFVIEKVIPEGRAEKLYKI